MNNKSIYIYKNNNYLPFDLYFNSIISIFKSNEYFKNINHTVVNNLKFLKNNIDFLILFMNDINDLYNINTYNIKIILIHADYILNHQQKDIDTIYNYFNFINYNNSYIWDYNLLNINYYNQNFSNKKYYYVPLLHNSYLEYIYSINKNIIPYQNRNIDILFLGNTTGSQRRIDCINQLSTKFKVSCVSYINDIAEYIKYIDDSKCVINIYSKESNKPFDYYRLAFFYSNKINVVTEDFIDDLIINDISNILPKTSIQTFFDYISNHLNKSEKELNDITNNIYNVWTTKYMDDYLINFFKSISF